MENDAFGNNFELTDESGAGFKSLSSEKGDPTLVRLIMKIKLIKTREQANYVLIGIAIASLLLSIFFFSTGTSSAPRLVVPAGPAGLPGASPAGNVKIPN